MPKEISKMYSKRVRRASTDSSTAKDFTRVFKNAPFLVNRKPIDPTIKKPKAVFAFMVAASGIRLSTGS